MDVERLVVRLTADVTNFDRSMTSVENSVLRLVRSIMPLGAMVELPVLAAAGAVTALGVAFGFATVESFRLAAAFERNVVALEVMTGSAETARSLMADILKMGVETPFHSKELFDISRVLKGYNVLNEDLIPTMRVLGDVAMGDVDKFQRIALAFGQVKAAGRLMGQEMRQFVNAGAITNEDLASVMGVSPARIKSMIEEGRISFNDVIRAFNQITGPGGRFFNINDRINKTVSGQWSALTETLEMTLARIGAGFFKAFDIGTVLKKATDFITVGEGHFDRFFENLRAGLEKAVDYAKFVWYWLERGYQVVGDWIQRNRTWLDQVVKGATAIAAVAAAAVTIGATLTGLTVVVAHMAAVLAIFTAVSLNVADIVDQLTEWHNFGSEIVKGWDQFAENMSGMWRAFKDAMAAGDWQLAGQIIGNALKIGISTIWYSMMAELAGLTTRVLLTAVRELEEKGRAALAGFLKLYNKFNNPAGEFLLNAGIDKDFADWQARSKKGVEENVAAVQKTLMMELDKHKIVVAQTEEIAKQLRIQKEIANVHNSLIGRAGLSLAAGADQAMRVDAAIAEELLRFDRSTGRAVAARTAAVGTDDSFSRMEYLMTRFGFAGATGVYRTGYEGALRNEFMPAPVHLSDGNPYYQIAESLQVSGQTLKYVERLQKEMERGIWAGAATDKLALFDKHLGMIQEAYQGPYSGGAFFQSQMRHVRMGGLINDKERDFALFEEYSNLKKAIGARTDKLPGAVFAGTTEAQDVINRAQLGRATVQEEIRNTLIYAAELQKAQKEYMAEAVIELRKLTEGEGTGWSNGAGGGMEDF